MTIRNGSRTTTVTVTNDTEQELIVIDDSARSGTTTYYITDGPDAVRNTTSGEIRYGSGESTIETNAGFTTAFTILGGFLFIGAAEWQPAGETTYEGEPAQAFEADSINETFLEIQAQGGFNIGLEASEVNSVDGRIILDENGLRMVSLRMETVDGTLGVDLTTDIGEGISVERPDWVDDSEFESALRPILPV